MATRRPLSIDQIVERSTIRPLEFEVKEWDGNVLLQGISKLEQKELWERAKTGVGEDVDAEVLNRLLLQHGMLDPIVDDAAYTKLSAGYAGSLDKIVMKIMEISHFGDKELRAVQKKFPTEPGGTVSV
jgi:hypothetical protein